MDVVAFLAGSYFARFAFRTTWSDWRARLTPWRFTIVMLGCILMLTLVGSRAFESSDARGIGDAALVFLWAFVFSMAAHIFINWALYRHRQYYRSGGRR